MKVGGTMFMWSIIIYMFFKRFSSGFDEQQQFRRVKVAQRIPDPNTELQPGEEILTYEQVTEVFGRVPAAPEPERI